MVKVKKDEDGVDRSVDVCGRRLPQARNAKIATCRFLRISTKSQMAGETRNNRVNQKYNGSL